MKWICKKKKNIKIIMVIQYSYQRLSPLKMKINSIIRLYNNRNNMKQKRKIYKIYYNIFRKINNCNNQRKIYRKKCKKRDLLAKYWIKPKLK